MPDPLLLRPGDSANLIRRDPASTLGAPGGKDETVAEYAEQHARLADLHDRLFAERRRSLLVVLQGIDTSGKDGTIRHLFSGLNPSGARVATFGVPTAAELEHDFLWRVHRQVPRSGEIVIFNRSHYEDVLTVRVHNLVPAHVWTARFEHINAFERLLHDGGTKVVKFLLHLSPDEQSTRLKARLDEPDKRWKFRAGDLAERQFWDQYQAACTDMLERTTTDDSPWFIIPADRVWFRNWAVTNVLVRVLRDMDPKYPPAEPLPQPRKR